MSKKNGKAVAVPEGYKMTEVGVIPEDWEVTSFEQLFSFSNGVNAEKAAYGKGIQFVNVLEPITYSHLHGPEIPGKITLSQNAAKNYLLEYGDVLFNRTSEVDSELGLAATFLGSNEVVFGGFVIRGRPITDKLDPEYSGYALRDLAIRSQIIPLGQGAVRANIGQQNLKRVKALIPPLPEQRAIATALTDTDDLIESLGALIAKKRRIKAGVMGELLSGERRLDGFEGEWETRSLGELANIKTGSRNNEDKVHDGKYPFFVRSANVEAINSFSYDCEAILVPGEGQIGSIFHYYLGKFDVHQRVYAITDYLPTVCGKYIYFYLKQYFGAHAFQNTVKATVDSLRLPTFTKFKMCLPQNFPEQQAIATLLTDIDQEIEALEGKLAKVRRVKEGMMGELLGGRVRLV